MKRIKLLTLIIGSSILISACGNGSQQIKNTEAQVQTEQEQKEEDKYPQITTEETKDSSQETEVKETETEEPKETEVVETQPSKVGFVSYEDFAVSYGGYTNYVDMYETERDSRIAICAPNSEDPKGFLVYDAATSRGIKLGDSKDQVIAAYGPQYKTVDYWAKSYNHDGLESRVNLNYVYLDERYPEVFFCLSFSLDQNDNVLDITYEAILIKWLDET